MAGYEMNPHHPYFRLAGAVAVAMAATFAAGATAHAQNGA
jgi:hypothetical protein